jgi:hypothetical protein
LKTERCEYYNATLCNTSGQACNETQECDRAEGDKRNHCFVLWNSSADGTPHVKLKVQIIVITMSSMGICMYCLFFQGCFINNNECFDQEECVARTRDDKNMLLYCCCEGDMCNQHFRYQPSPTQLPQLKGGCHST